MNNLGFLNLLLTINDSENEQPCPKKFYIFEDRSMGYILRKQSLKRQKLNIMKLLFVKFIKATYLRECTFPKLSSLFSKLLNLPIL